LTVSGSSRRVLFIFLDGVGIGKADPAVNPFFSTPLKTLPSILGGNLPDLDNPRYQSNHVTLVPIDANLGVEGLPQSGTGQTSLLTGVNAAQYIGKHFGPYPFSSLKPILRETSIYTKLEEQGKSVMYANAFPHQFFDHMKSKRARIAATTFSWISSGHTLNSAEDLAKGNALSSDITNEGWKTRLGYPDMPLLTAREAGKLLARISRSYDFVLYEYYLTDHAGHERSFSLAGASLLKLDSLLEGILQEIDLSSTLVLLTSDHGNMEDLSTKSHTRNPVPFLAIGAGNKIIERAQSLTDVYSIIVEYLK
jgi:hypothetical protein